MILFIIVFALIAWGLHRRYKRREAAAMRWDPSGNNNVSFPDPGDYRLVAAGLMFITFFLWLVFATKVIQPNYITVREPISDAAFITCGYDNLIAYTASGERQTRDFHNTKIVDSEERVLVSEVQEWPISFWIVAGPGDITHKEIRFPVDEIDMSYYKDCSDA